MFDDFVAKQETTPVLGPADSRQAERTTPFVAVSRFVVANGLGDEVETAFRNRLGRVDLAPGFRSLQVLRGNDDPREFWLMTEWSSEIDFDHWHRSHAYRDAHQGIPRGLKLVKGAQVIRRLRKVAT